MKIAQPTLSQTLDVAGLEDFLEGELEGVMLEGLDATGQHVAPLDMAGVRIEKSLLTAALLERVSARDVLAIRTDFSATQLSDAAVNRARFADCRMNGVDFSHAALHDVTFAGCKLDMVNFRFADIRRVHFVDCELREADFLGATLHDVSFESCTLNKTVFDQAKCKKMDLRTSELIELSGWVSLKGATIDGAQLAAAAPYLAHAIGLEVK